MWAVVFKPSSHRHGAGGGEPKVALSIYSKPSISPTKARRRMDPGELTHRLKREARRLGFDLAGAAPAVGPPGHGRLEEWIAAGYAGQMRYLADRLEAHAHPGHVLEGARSLLVLAMNYRGADPVEPGPGQGRVSRYAWGHDYHDLIHARLKQLAAYHRRLVPAARVRGVVDTAPLMEREFALLAGLGWRGKNTLLLNRRHGSWLFLAVLLSGEVLAYDQPASAEYCGSCRACLEACPTQALVEPYVLDARRCISYLTIELREGLPGKIRHQIGDWVFGCDVCQEVCPWNRKVPAGKEEAFRPRAGMRPIELAGLFELDETAFRRRFRKTPLWRARRRGLLRNAALALGNRPDPVAIGGLVRGLQDDESPVRAACAWALGRHGTSPARQALAERLAAEQDRQVREEIANARG